MKRFIRFASIAALLAALPFAAQAASHEAKAEGETDAHAGHHPSAGQAAAMSEGEVRKVDTDAQKITLRHGELKNLGMPPMTMVFRVADPALLDKVKKGDKVGFVAEKIGGQFTVTRIEAKQ